MKLIVINVLFCSIRQNNSLKSASLIDLVFILTTCFYNFGYFPVHFIVFLSPALKEDLLTCVEVVSLKCI